MARNNTRTQSPVSIDQVVAEIAAGEEIEVLVATVEAAPASTSATGKAGRPASPALPAVTAEIKRLAALPVSQGGMLLDLERLAYKGGIGGLALALTASTGAIVTASNVAASLVEAGLATDRKAAVKSIVTLNSDGSVRGEERVKATGTGAGPGRPATAIPQLVTDTVAAWEASTPAGERTRKGFLSVCGGALMRGGMDFTEAQGFLSRVWNADYATKRVKDAPAATVAESAE
jgi:hypothetical protein